MTLNEFNELGLYVARKTEYPTIMSTKTRDIENKYFKYIKLINDTCCIRHEEDKSKKAIMYKTLNGAEKYVDKWCIK